MSQQRKDKERKVTEEQPQKDPAFRRKLIIGAVIVLVLGGAYYAVYHQHMHKYDGFARCLTQKGVKMYGAYWCPHCTEQKELFGPASFKYAPYVECGVPGTTAKLSDACADAAIKHFPTWQFPPVGERVEGVIPLQDLSFRTGCPLQ